MNSTSSSTRVELTVSPTSLRACSCSTLRASSSRRASRARTRWTFRTAAAAWAANARSIVVVRSSNGSTLVRHRLIAPTTSSSRMSGAEIKVR